MNIPNDSDCTQCETKAILRKCFACGVSAKITNCGHFQQPRPLAAGMRSGEYPHYDFCSDCAQTCPDLDKLP